MTMSILHRVTGGALYFGTLLVAWWLTAAAGPQEYFDFVNGIYGSWFGRLVLFGYTWALMHHMLGGIRHFVWDTASYMDKHTASKLGWATLVGSVILTVLVWVVGYYARGA
jgi:succinate dehydrogenase / fumarate reductase cytochrome b subunit